MLRPRTPLQQELTTDVWRLSEHRTALLKQLADVEEAQRQAVTIAAIHGVRQNLLAEISGLTEARVSRIVHQTVLSDEPVSTLHSAWARLLDDPTAHLERCTLPVSQTDIDAWNRRFELVHGKPVGLARGSVLPADA